MVPLDRLPDKNKGGTIHKIFRSQLLTGEVTVRAVDRLEPGPVNGDQLSAEQIQLATEKNKLPEDGLERMAVVLTEISNGLEVGLEVTKKPDHLQIASGLGLKPPAGAHAVDVAIDVELEQIGWVVTGASGGLRLHPTASLRPRFLMMRCLARPSSRTVSTR